MANLITLIHAGPRIALPVDHVLEGDLFTNPA
jgi:hypothetical protein